MLPGDPIEIGAAAAVLSEQNGLQASGRLPPLVAAASKSWLGHAEPAAGVVGLLHASHTLQHGLLAPIALLRQVNDYVSHSLAQVRSGSSTAAEARIWSMPRQSCGLATSHQFLPGQQPVLGALGTSAFAFQVTHKAS